MVIMGQRRTENGWEHIKLPDCCDDRNRDLEHLLMHGITGEPRGIPEGFIWPERDHAPYTMDETHWGDGDGATWLLAGELPAPYYRPLDTLEELYRDDGHTATWLIANELPPPYERSLDITETTRCWLLWMRSISLMLGPPDRVRFVVFLCY